MGFCRLRSSYSAKLDNSQTTDHQGKGRYAYPLPVEPRMFHLGVSPNLMRTFIQFLAQSLDDLDLSQALDTLKNMGFKLVLRGGIELAIQVFFCKFVPV